MMWLLGWFALQSIVPTTEELSVQDQDSLRIQMQNAGITVVDSVWAHAWKLRWSGRDAFLISGWTAREGGLQSGSRLFLLGPSMDVRVFDS